MSSNPRTAALLAALLLAAAAAGGADRSFVYLLPERGNAILVMDQNGVRRVVDIGRTGAEAVFPTPGGKYVFVTFQGSSEVAVIDAESQSLNRRFNLTQGIPEQIAFSPTGERAYVSLAGSSEVLFFDHRRSVLTLRETRLMGLAGAPLLLNRRGTRLYRSGSEGLGFYLETTGEIIRSVAAPGGVALWSFSPDFRYLWGVSASDGSLVVVDERASRLAATLPGPFAAFAPIAADDRAYLVSRSGDRLVPVSSRSFLEEKAIAIPGPARSVASTGSGVWLLVGTDLVRIELPSGRAASRVAFDQPIRAIVAVTLRPGEGYACF